jgi:hypothetical protein
MTVNLDAAQVARGEAEAQRSAFPSSLARQAYLSIYLIWLPGENPVLHFIKFSLDHLIHVGPIVFAEEVNSLFPGVFFRGRARFKISLVKFLPKHGIESKVFLCCVDNLKVSSFPTLLYRIREPLLLFQCPPT